MKKFALLLLLVSLTRIGVAYADTTNSNSGDYLFNSQQAAANLNQVLALLVGPKGDPGPAGVAGKDGLIGINGVDGLPGAPGAAGQDGRNGVDGKDGVSVIATTFAGSRGTCTTGGTEFKDANGNLTYACNGANGANGINGLNGLNGLNGADGAPGSGGGGSVGGGFTYAQGEMLAGACDKFVVVVPKRKYTLHGFGFESFSLGNNGIVKTDTSTVPSSTLSGGLADGCRSLLLTLEFFTKSAYAADAENNPPAFPAAPYTNNDHITCVSRQTLQAYGSVGGGPYVLKDIDSSGTAGRDDFDCTNDAGQSLELIDLDTNDYTNRIGLSIG